MKLKYWKILCVPIIFLLSSLFHFLYDWFPCFITSLFSGVNESIWEHNKIIFSSFLCVTIIEKLFYKNKKNIIFSGFLSMLLCSLIVLLIFSPIYFYVLDYKDNMFITFSVFVFSIIVSQIVSYYLMDMKFNNYIEYFSCFLWLCIFVFYGYLTYNPLRYDLFYDFMNHKYGI